MTTAVCTLFEGSYHVGLGALVNSLFTAGFRGSLFAGYRGPLPPWANHATPMSLPPWTGASQLDVGAGLRLLFLPLDVPHHFTNYKADFMLALLDGPARSDDALFYIDPDICVLGQWHLFEQWVDCGVALCEDVNSPLPHGHPRRVGWRRYYGQRGLPLTFRGAEYVNGGVVGVRHSARSFLETWKRAMDLMEEEIGSLAAASIHAGADYRSRGFFDCFDRTDQDALNAAIEASTVPVSIVGQEAMAFKPGEARVPHAIGADKPWQRRYLGQALRGVPPRLIDKVFWSNVRTPLPVVTSFRTVLKRIDVRLAAAVGRLLSRA